MGSVSRLLHPFLAGKRKASGKYDENHSSTTLRSQSVGTSLQLKASRNTFMVFGEAYFKHLSENKKSFEDLEMSESSRKSAPRHILWGTKRQSSPPNLANSEKDICFICGFACLIMKMSQALLQFSRPIASSLTSGQPAWQAAALCVLHTKKKHLTSYGVCFQ